VLGLFVNEPLVFLVYSTPESASVPSLPFPPPTPRIDPPMQSYGGLLYSFFFKNSSVPTHLPRPRFPLPFRVLFGGLIRNHYSLCGSLKCLPFPPDTHVRFPHSDELSLVIVSATVLLLN